MTTIVIQAGVVKYSARNATTAIAIRLRSGASDCRIPSQAPATTARATSFNPRNNPSIPPPERSPIPSATSTMTIAEGRVNPTQAANPPNNPALS